MLAHKIKDVWAQWNGEEINETQNPPNIEALWDDKELNAIGLYRVEVKPVDDGMVAASWSLQDEKGLPVYVCELVTAPKSAPTIEERLTTIEAKLGLTA